MPLNRRETFSFPAEEYPDLAVWLDGQPQGQRSQAIAEALVLHARRELPSPMVVVQKLDYLITLLEHLSAKIGGVQ